MHPLDHTGSVKLMNGLSCDFTFLIGENKFSFTFSRHAVLNIFINITICVTRDGDRFFPCGNEWCYAAHCYWRPEYCAVKYCPDCSVGALPHLCEVIFLYPLSVGGYSGAFHSNAIFFCGNCGIGCNLVFCFLPVFKSKVVVFGFQINIWLKEYILDELPYNPCHLISVHLNERCGHFYLC
ncbi:MAG: hypothetical protein BWY70_02041 [Bacteroidetes bacterium ADurb.Bin408]|nr:MAG: hypothetical protein BWY70_02041 [Bacteroidetes bacterium ADurb.Bin408]